MPIVPEVAFLSLDSAVGVLGNHGFEFAGVFQEPSDEVTRGYVIRAVPASGDDVPADTRVSLVLSSGHAPSGIVPDVVGLRLREAEGVLELEGYSPSAYEQATPDVEEGVVISMNPPAGTYLDPGGIVRFAVSSGWHPDPPKPPPEDPVVVIQ